MSWLKKVKLALLWMYDPDRALEETRQTYGYAYSQEAASGSALVSSIVTDKKEEESVSGEKLDELMSDMDMATLRMQLTGALMEGLVAKVKELDATVQALLQDRARMQAVERAARLYLKSPGKLSQEALAKALDVVTPS